MGGWNKRWRVSKSGKPEAEVMGISEDTAEMRLHRARSAMRQALAEYVRPSQPRPGAVGKLQVKRRRQSSR